MSLTVRFKPPARADIEAASAWYEARGTGLGAEFLRSVSSTSARISREPEMYVQIRGPIRRAVLARFPYALFYLVEGRQVVVLACLHHRRAPQRWPG